MAIDRYNPLRETFQTDDVVSIEVLNDALEGGAIPGDLILDSLNSDNYLFDSYYFMNTTSSRNRIAGFDKRDIPIIKGIGVFCNMGDCLVDISNHRKSCQGFTLNLTYEAYKADGTLIGAAAVITSPALVGNETPRFRFNTLNAIFDYNISLIDTIRSRPEYFSDPENAYCVLRATPLEKLVEVDEQAAVEYSTVNLNPLIGAKRFTMWSNMIVDHTFSLVEAIVAPEQCNES